MEKSISSGEFRGHVGAVRIPPWPDTHGKSEEGERDAVVTEIGVDGSRGKPLVDDGVDIWVDNCGDLVEILCVGLLARSIGAGVGVNAIVDGLRFACCVGV